MGFLSYSLKYFKTEISYIENVAADRETIYRAKQLLKILDDLADEGYTTLHEELEKSCRGISRLKKYLSVNDIAPFSEPCKIKKYANAEYEEAATELTEVIQSLISSAKKCANTIKGGFFEKLVGFCEWIGYKEDVAYVFLLRDTLLPYIFYKNKSRKSIYPWLLSRSSFAWLTGESGVDDKLRALIYDALEGGKINDFDDFCKTVLPDMRSTIARYPTTEKILTDLLHTLKAEQIIVIESGCCGTFPMLLKSLDSRVDVRMYTTYPYLLKAYGDRVYTPEYEDNRLFETFYAHELYMRFVSLKNNRFYVGTCMDDEIKNNSFAEVKTMLSAKAPSENHS